MTNRRVGADGERVDPEESSTRAVLPNASGTFDADDAQDVEPWRELERVLEGPMPQPELSLEVGRGTTDYERYVRTTELRALQLAPSERVHPDELLFQVTHQSEELWMKLAASEAVSLVRALDADRLTGAAQSIEKARRALVAMRVATEALELLTPHGFQQIRGHLGDGSGLQSPGYRGLQLALSAISDALDRALERRGLELRAIYEDEGLDPWLLFVCERLVELDEEYQRWLFGHFQLVRRTIGVDRSVQALDGYPTKALEVRMRRPAFPDLWEVRVLMTRSWSRVAGFTPGAPRTHAEVLRFREAPAPTKADERSDT